MKTKLILIAMFLFSLCSVSLGQDYPWLEDEIDNKSTVFDGYWISLLFGVGIFLFYLISGLFLSFLSSEDVKGLKNMKSKDKKDFAYMFIWIVVSASSFFQVSSHIREFPISSVLVFIVLPIVLYFVFEDKIKSFIDSLF